MLLVSLAALSAATLSNYTLPPPRPAKPSACPGDCASRYRVPASSDDGPTTKSRALADDGTRCNVVGRKRCTSKGRTIWRSAY